MPVSRPCKFGRGCTRHDCYFEHPTGRIVDGTAQDAAKLLYGLLINLDDVKANRLSKERRKQVSTENAAVPS